MLMMFSPVHDPAISVSDLNLEQEKIKKLAYQWPAKYGSRGLIFSNN